MEKYNPKSPWWRKYRQAKYRPRQQLGFEMVLRMSFVQVLKEYLQHCSLAGMKQVCERDLSLKRRILWCLLVGSTYGVVVYMLSNLWSATFANPLIVSLGSSTYPIHDIDFPAVALCNVNLISRKRVKEMARIKYTYYKKFDPNVTMEDIEWYFIQLGRLLDFSYNETMRQSLLRFPNYDVPGEIVIDTMKKLAPPCHEMILRCAWGGQVVNCSDYFAMRRTTLGHCCAFNYVLNTPDMPNQHHPFDVTDWTGHRFFVSNNHGASLPEDNKQPDLTVPALRQKQAGKYYGLAVVLDSMLEDYAYPLRVIEGFDVILFDPIQYADPNSGRVVHRIAEPNEATILELHSVRMSATPEVRKYPLSTRRCLFHDELPMHYGNMYSYSACIASCRVKTIRSLCKCTPYFIPTRSATKRVCTLRDLPCLNKYREKVLYLFPFFRNTFEGLEMEQLDSLYCPECLPDCELTKHSTKAQVIPIGSRTLMGLKDKVKMLGLAEGLNFTNTSKYAMLYIYQPTNDGVLDRLDVVSYWYEILSNIGGFAGVLVGFSIISLVEIVYYFAVRFTRVTYTNFVTYY